MSGKKTNTTKVPSMKLRPEDLLALENLILEHTDNPVLKVTIAPEGIPTTYHSIEGMISDDLTSAFASSFELYFEGDQGKGKLTANSRQNDGQFLSLEGECEWCEEIDSTLTQFFAIHRNKLRTFLSGQSVMAPITVILSILTGHYFLMISPLGIYYPPDHQIPWLYLQFFTGLSILLGVTYRHRLFPYARWDLTNETFRWPFFYSAVKILILVSLTTLGLFIYSGL